MSDTKNAIYSRLQVDRHDLPFESLDSIVAAARDQFHSYVAKTVKCNYKRPAIYLVDSWVTKALGLFLAAGDLRVLQDLITGSEEATPSRRMTDFGPIYEVLRSVADYEERLHGLRILDVRAEFSRLWEAVLGWLSGEGSPGVCATALDRVTRPVELLWRALVADENNLGAHANGEWYEALEQSEARARKNFSKALPRKPKGLIRGFGEGRNGGIVFQDIPELDIRAPAVLVSPLSILRWSERHPLPEIRPVEQWIGIRDPKLVRFALALGNVVQHELTHVLLGLSNDPRPKDDMSQVQHHWDLYERMPHLEEGIANFLANLVTLNTMGLVAKEVRNHQIVDYRSRNHLQMLRHWSPYLEAVTGAYYPTETSCLLKAWEQTGMSFGDFGGVLNAYATHIKDSRWERFYEHLGAGRIVVER